MTKLHNTQLEKLTNDTVRIHHSQDVTQMLEETKQMAKEQDQAGKDMKLAARIPMNLIFMWEQEGIIMQQVGIDPDMTARFWKKLQSPEWAHLRVWNGRMV